MNIDKEEKKPKFDFAESVGIGDAEITNFNFENRRSASEDGGDMGIDNRVEYNMMVRTHRTGIRKTGFFSLFHLFSIFYFIFLLYLNFFTKVCLSTLPTGSVKVECSPPERKVVSSSHSRDLKNGN